MRRTWGGISAVEDAAVHMKEFLRAEIGAAAKREFHGIPKIDVSSDANGR